MAGLDPAIYVLPPALKARVAHGRATWIPGSSPGDDVKGFAWVHMTNQFHVSGQQWVKPGHARACPYLWLKLAQLALAWVMKPGMSASHQPWIFGFTLR